MAFTTKPWEDEPHPLEVQEGKREPTSKTPVDAAALVDAEERLAKWAEELAAGRQPLDADLTAIAALTTTTFGRSLLEVATAAAGRTVLGLGTASTQATSAFDASGAAAAAQAASQPLDSDLTAIAALTTTAFGRELLTKANAAAVLSASGVVRGVVKANASIAAGSGFTVEMKETPGSYHIVLSTPLPGKGVITVTPIFAGGPGETEAIDPYAEEEEEGKKWHVYMVSYAKGSTEATAFNFRIEPVA